MASLHRRPRSKYWHAAWRDVAGKLHFRSTKETNRSKAWEIARGWEHVERSAKTEAQVRKVMSEILERNTGQPLRNPTVSEWFIQWLNGKREETKKRYRGICTAFLTYLGRRGDQPIRDVAPRDIQGYVDELRFKKKASDNTVSLHLQALRSAFNFARRMQVLDSSPTDPVSVTVDEEVERALFTEAEAKRLVEAADGEWKTLLKIGYYTGLRLVKAATLDWSSLDLAGKTMSIMKPGKRGKALRSIPLHEELVAHLATLVGQQTPAGFIMPALAGNDSGGKRGLSRRFKQIAARAGVDLWEIIRPNGHKFCRRSFHSLRHGFASGLANRGVPSERRRELTGHKTEREHGRYTHLETEALRAEINKLPPIPD